MYLVYWNKIENILTHISVLNRVEKKGPKQTTCF